MAADEPKGCIVCLGHVTPIEGEIQVEDIVKVCVAYNQKYDRLHGIFRERLEPPAGQLVLQ